jgi:hypothetical protein
VPSDGVLYLIDNTGDEPKYEGVSHYSLESVG